MFHLRMFYPCKQTCIGRVLDCIEARARHGFQCNIGDQTMLFFPRIGVMSLDTPERVKYFGLQNKQSCAICRKRKGRSAARTATCHSPEQVAELLACANEEVHTRPLQHRRKRARERLARHGLDYKKRCKLTDHAKHSLVQIESIGPRLFGGLARYERMHVYFIAYCTYLIEVLIKSVPNRNYGAVRKVVRQCQQFRDPWTGVTHPRLPNLLKMTHLTAERRVRAIFYWAHVLGIHARVIYEPIRLTARRAVACLQLILVAVRGHRAYTSGELDVIFKTVGQQFFMALEELADWHDEQSCNRQATFYQRDPEKYAQPARFERTKRSVYVLYPICLRHVKFTSTWKCSSSTWFNKFAYVMSSLRLR